MERKQCMPFLLFEVFGDIANGRQLAITLFLVFGCNCVTFSFNRDL